MAPLEFYTGLVYKGPCTQIVHFGRKVVPIYTYIGAKVGKSIYYLGTWTPRVRKSSGHVPPRQYWTQLFVLWENMVPKQGIASLLLQGSSLVKGLAPYTISRFTPRAAGQKEQQEGGV